MAPDAEVWNRADSDRHLVGLARGFLAVPSDEVHRIIEDGVVRARDWAAASRAAMVVSHPSTGDILFAAYGSGDLVQLLAALLERADSGAASNLAEQIRAGQDVVLRSIDELPEDSAAERALLEDAGVCSLIIAPILDADGQRLGCLAIDSVGSDRDWEGELVGRVRMLAEVWIGIVHRQQIDLDRQRSDLRFEKLAGFTKDIVCEFNDRGELTFVSGSVEATLGVPPEAVLGRGFLDLVHPDDRERTLGVLQLDSGLPADYVTIRLRKSDGSYLWMEGDGTSFPGMAGPRRILALLRDISHRYEHQAELEEHLAIEREVTRLSREFVGLESASLAEAFRNALETSAGIAGCDQSYVVITMPDLNAGKPEIHFWTRPGAESPAIEREAITDKQFRWFAHQLRRHEAIVLPTLDALPDEAKAERAMLEARGIQSYLGLPLTEGDRSVGVLGFASIGRTASWSDHQLTMLSLVAELFSAVFRRARGEAHVREREERFRVLADQSPDPILEFSSSGRILFASHDFARLVGDADDDWVGRRLIDFLAPVELSRVAEVREQALGGGRVPPAVFQCRHKDGTHRYLEATVRSFRTARGELHGIATLRDVTARLETERTLEQQLLLERQIANISRDLMTRDFDRFDDDVRRSAGHVADLAQADHCAVVSFGTGADGGPEVFEWFTEKLPESRRSPIPLDPAEFPALTAALRRGERFYFERPSQLGKAFAAERAYFERRAVESLLVIPFMQEQRLSGVFVLATLVEPVEWTSKDMAILNLASDIIHGALGRRHAARRLEHSQLQLLQSQKMEAVGTLAGGIAHDFNNQLAVMLGNARFVLERASEGDEEREALLDLERAAEHCAQLTRSLLAFSRQSDQAPSTLEVGHWLEDVAELMEPLLPSSIQLDVDVEPGTGAVHGDETQLQQVMVNLLVNARDAMPRGGRIVVHARRRALTGEERDLLGVDGSEFVELRVEDTGVGMADAVSSRIFEPFFTTKPLGEGTGLGLATVYGIVQQCGGAVEVESRPDAGTTFRVHLPRHEAPASAAAAVGERAAGPRRSFDTVLLVEDESAVRRVVRRMLDSHAKRVIEARNGDEALELVGASLAELDLLVTDMVMPRMGGLALSRKIAESRPNLPTLFLSGYPDDDLDLELEPGRNRLFLQKPFTQRDLEQALETLLAFAP